MGKVINYLHIYKDLVEKQQSGFGVSNKRYKQMKKLGQWFDNDTELLAQLQQQDQVIIIK